MKHISVFLFLSFSLAFGQVITDADYERAAAMLGINTNDYIDHNIYPQWTPENLLWYADQRGEENVYKIIDPETQQSQTATTREELLRKTNLSSPDIPTRYEIASPDGKYIAFLKDWNLWVRDTENNKEWALTTDGYKDYGYATDNAGWTHGPGPVLKWSPDSKKIATFRQDQRHLNDMYLVETIVGAPRLEAWKYPLPGDSAIIKIERLVIEVNEEPKAVFFRMDPDDRRATYSDDIAGRGGEMVDVAWSADGTKLVFVSTSRDHKSAKVRMADTRTGVVTDLFEETVETQFESGQDASSWRYLSESDEIIWYSERSNWGHLYLYDAKTGELKNQITSGDWVVREIVEVDEDKRQIYFYGGGREEGNPYFRYLYRVSFNGKNLKLLTPDPGNHNVSFSPDGKYFTDSYSQPHVPPVHELRQRNGKHVMTLESTDITRLVDTGWKPTIPFSVKSANEEWDLYGLTYTPTDLDESKRYPVIVYIYPGPQGGSVGTWSFVASYRDNQALAELGFIVVMIEGSCNPQRSKAFHDACYGDMAENTLSDQIYGLKQLAQRYPYMDLDKVGIWGHSGGGFATAAAMFKHPDFFKVGISESGNHDNRNYEDDWGERYIGMEIYGENGVSNYQVQANQEYAENLKGKLLLIHGGMDDNVPPYNTYLVADALIKANRDFDMIILPNARHGYGRDSYYIMRRRWDYFVEHLLGAEPPANFDISATFKR